LPTFGGIDREITICLFVDAEMWADLYGVFLGERGYSLKKFAAVTDKHHAEVSEVLDRQALKVSASIAFSRKAVAYWPSPRFFSQSPTSMVPSRLKPTMDAKCPQNYQKMFERA